MQLLTVVGGTGTQGRSVIEAALKGEHGKIRALTRNTESQNAKDLAAKGVEVVKADLNDESSLVKAFEGSSHIYAVTDFFEPFATSGPEKAIEIETAQGINLARAAAKTTTLQHYIWSTLPNGSKITNGKYNIPHFVAKNNIDDFIKKDASLLAKTTFLWITFYGNNFQYPMFTPNFLKTSGSYVQLSPASATTPVKTIGSPSANIGTFALAIFQHPEKTLGGKFVAAYVEETTTGQMLKDFSDVTGKKATYVQVGLEEFSEIWGGGWGYEMGNMMALWSEVKERAWSGEEGILTKDDLGLAEADFAGGHKGAVKEMDWSALL